MAIVNGKERYQANAKFVTYLFAIAHRRAVERYRLHVDINDDSALEQFASEDVPDDRLYGAQASEALVAAVQALPDLQREAFLLRMEGELDVGEIALATGTTHETAKSRLRYAYRRLRSALEDWR